MTAPYCLMLAPGHYLFCRMYLDDVTSRDDPMIACQRCVMDSRDDPALNIIAGECSYCRGYRIVADRDLLSEPESSAALERVLRRIRETGRTRSYDAIMGLSGGVDSSYVAFLAREFGLRVLAVHLDNGWNSEIAARNIQNIVQKLNLDLFTHVIDWTEFRDLQRAYLAASVIDIEAITDHAILATLHRVAADRGIRFILSGTNLATEGILPRHWVFNKTDHVNIRAIHDAFGSIPLKTFPLFTTRQKKRVDLLGIETVSLLNHVPYVKTEAKEIISTALDWRDYGGKHHESVFTRFYQGYILPTKFGVDKRNAHLSSLICSGQLSRDNALLELRKPAYDAGQLRADRIFVLKKLGYTEEEFDRLMTTPPVPHETYAVERSLYERYPLAKPLRPAVSWIKRAVRSITTAR